LSVCAITGASGLVGGNLADALLRDGHRVVATKRASSKIEHLAHLKIEWRDADLSDVDALARAFEGADVVFHCAATVQISPRVTPLLHEGNIVGTDNVLEAVRRAKVRRLVHCSSVTASAVTDGSRDTTEEDAWNFPEHGLADGYATTKHQSQERVLAAKDIDLVVVQPTYMLGPYDVKPSSGQMVVEIARGRLKVGAPGFQNCVDVRDVARGMILAWKKGKRGETYILGGENMPYTELFGRIARELSASGKHVKAPTFVPPYAIAFAVGAFVEGFSALVGRDTQLSRSTVRYAYCKGHRFSSDKAKRDLGYAPGSPDEGIRAAIAWMRERGMLPKRPE
jgi:dihydroflavonol-4-reductase